MSGFLPVLCCCLFILALNIFILTSRPNTEDLVSVSQVTLSSQSFISASALCFFRMLALTTILLTNFAILFRKPIVLTGTTRNQELRKISLAGLSRFTTFTVWSWCLQGIYFSFAIICTWLPSALPSSQNVILSYFLFWTWVLFEVSLSVSILVSLVVTYVLYPFSVKNNADSSILFEWPSLLMHNLNLVFMTIELLINAFPTVDPWHAPYGIFYGMAYVVFAWIWELKGGVFYYFFLNYSHRKAPAFYFGLVAALYVFFFFGWLMKTELVLYPTAAPFAIVIGLSQALMFRPYKVK